MLISQREASVRLGAIGMPRRQARLALDAGLAGEPLRTAAALRYDAARVDELIARPLVAQDAVTRECPHGCFLDRRVVDVRELEEVRPDTAEDLRLDPRAARRSGRPP